MWTPEVARAQLQAAGGGAAAAGAGAASTLNAEAAAAARATTRIMAMWLHGTRRRREHDGGLTCAGRGRGALSAPGGDAVPGRRLPHHAPLQAGRAGLSASDLPRVMLPCRPRRVSLRFTGRTVPAAVLHERGAQKAQCARSPGSCRPTLLPGADEFVKALLWRVLCVPALVLPRAATENGRLPAARCMYLHLNPA